MELNVAIAVWLYTKDNTAARDGPAKEAKDEAWHTICQHARAAIEYLEKQPR